MANATVTVSVSNGQINANPSTITLHNVGGTGTSSVQWTGSGCRLENITLGFEPPAGSTLPVHDNSWTFTYPDPDAPTRWNYTIGATSDLDGLHYRRWDPEIDNDN